MSYGNTTTEILSSDSTTPFEIPLNNNADIFNFTVEPLETFAQGRLFVEVRNPISKTWETVFTAHGTRQYLCLVHPRAITLQHQSLDLVRFTPDSMEAGKTYKVSVENLSSWSDG